VLIWIERNAAIQTQAAVQKGSPYKKKRHRPWFSSAMIGFEEENQQQASES
jgi:hypothetical protein